MVEDSWTAGHRPRPAPVQAELCLGDTAEVVCSRKAYRHIVCVPAVGRLIAGEESGGFAYRGHLPERDGVLSGLYILDLIARKGKNLTSIIDELFRKVGAHYYDRDDITMTPADRDRVAQLLPTLEPKELAGLPVSGYDRADGLRFVLPDGAWALIRLSGTEPLMRIYTEVRDEALVRPVLDAVRGLTSV